ncbi:hypothetical protein BsWGS_15986 [Bradybaena similaris]
MKITCCPSCGSNFTTWTTSAKATNKQALVLSCGHSCCEACVTQRTKKVATESALYHAQVACPTCKHITLMENGVKDLPVNVYLSAFIEMNQRGRWMEWRGLNLGQLVHVVSSHRTQRSTDPETKDCKCKMCVTKSATCKCVDCDSMLCGSCFDKVHKLSVAIKHHIPVALSSVCQLVSTGESDGEAKCAEHNRILEYFCEDDSISICSRCYIIGKHQNHSITSIEDKNKQVLEEIGSELPLARLVLQHLNRIDKKIVSVQPQLKTETKSLIENISASFLKLHSLIQAREMEIIKQVNSAYKEHMNSVDKQREMMDKARGELEDVVQKSSKLFENSSTILDGHALLEALRKARTTPCIVVKKDDTEEAQLKWHETYADNLTAVINAYGSISGAPQMSIQFATIEEASEHVEDDDKLSANSLGSESSIGAAASFPSVPGNASGAEAGEDVVMEDIDGDSDVPRSSRGVSRETICLPVVKGPPQKVTVTHIRSPNEFCVQLASSKRQLETLAHNINMWCRKSSSAKHVPLVIEKDMFVLARYTADKQWYRAQVVGVEKSPDDKDSNYKVHVKYIDFGNDELLPIKELRMMQDRFIKLPVFAVLCSLTNIAPFEEDAPWSLECIQEFHKMTQNQMLMMTTIRMQGAVYEVDLARIPMPDALDDNFVSVRDILIFLDLARFRTFSDASIKSAAPPAYPKVDFIKPTPMKNGATVGVIVTHVVSPMDIYVVCRLEEHEYYVNMHEEMQQMYNKDICNIYSLFYPRAEMLCAAKASDGEWHRAKVLTSPQHKEVSVKLVDSGITQTVRYDHLKKLHNSFVILPIQAIPCQLMDVCPVDGPDGQWSDEAKLWSSHNLTGAIGYARFIRYSQDMRIVLWVEKENSTELTLAQSVNFTLVDKHFAQSTGPSSVSKAQETSSGGITHKHGDDDDCKGHSKESIPSLTNALSKISVFTNSSRGAMPDTTKRILKKKPVVSSASTKTELHKTGRSTGQDVQNNKSADEEAQAREVHKVLNSYGSPSTQKLETSYIQVSISNYISPSEFYVQVTDTQKDLWQLMKDMQEALGNLQPCLTQSWSVGDYCAAIFTPDELWYRANIVRKVSDDEFEVEYVDFGNVDVVKKSSLQSLPPEFGKRMPCAAARCHLANLLPAGSMNANKWSQTAVEFMASLIKDRKLYIKQEGDPTEMGLPVDLILEEEIPETAFEPKSQKYHSMRKAIIRNGLAMPTKKQSEPSTPDSPGPSLLQRFIFANDNQPDQDQDKQDLADLNPSLLADNVTNNSQKTAGSARAFVDTVSDRLESDKGDIFSLPSYPLPELKVEMDVVPTYIDVCGVIYVQPYAWEGRCAHLNSELQRIYGLPSSVDFTEWKVGQLCVAQFPDDALWYRAQLLKVRDDKFKVLYVDFGNSAWVTVSQLREMLPVFAEDHPFAYRCVLYDLEPISPSSSWPVEVLDYINKLVVNHKCVLVVVEAEEGSPLKVQLFRGETNLCEELISKNLATSPLTIKHFCEQSSLIGQVLARQNPYHQLDVGAVGDTFRALMIHIELPNVIYLQRDLEIEPEGSDFVKASEVAEINSTISEFVEMSEKLKSSKLMPMPRLPDVGMMCAAPFSADKQLYRALCVQCYPETNSCLVVFVDYGTSEVVPRSSVRQLHSEFWSTPAQALRCHISCPSACQPSQQLKHHTFVGIISSLAHRELLARIVSKSPLTVEVMVEESGQWQVPYKHLLEELPVGQSVQPLVKQHTDDGHGADITVQKINGQQSCGEKWNGERGDESPTSLEERSEVVDGREAEDAEGLVMKAVPSSFAVACTPEKCKQGFIEAENTSEEEDDDDVDWVAVAAKLVEQKEEGK